MSIILISRCLQGGSKVVCVRYQPLLKLASNHFRMFSELTIYQKSVKLHQSKRFETNLHLVEYTLITVPNSLNDENERKQVWEG